MSQSADPGAPFAMFGEVEAVPRTRFQKIVARTMVANAGAIPHVAHHDEVDVTSLEIYRKRMAPGEKISPLIFLIKAVVDSLKVFPQFNASLSADGEVLVLKKYFHIGVAVDGPLGLLVPVIRDCDQKDIPTVAAELKALSAMARGKGLAMDKMSGGCFTLSSLGGVGGIFFTPIINAPEVAILGATSVRTQPVWTGEAFEPRQLLPLSLSYDHRVINGADAARFVHHIGAELGKWAAA